MLQPSLPVGVAVLGASEPDRLLPQALIAAFQHATHCSLLAHQTQGLQRLYPQLFCPQETSQSF
jgi:hypothetical protein